MRERTRVVSLVAVLVLLAGCGGSNADPPDSDGTAGDGSSSAAGESPSADESPDPPEPSLRERLLAFSDDYNQARFACFSDPPACQRRYDDTLGRFVAGLADQQLRSGLAENVAQGVRTRNQENEFFYLMGVETFKRKPIDAALALCVVDKGIRFVPAKGDRPEQIVDDREMTYSMVLRIQQVGQDEDELRVVQIGSTAFVPLVGKYGDCAPYAR